MKRSRSSTRPEVRRTERPRLELLEDRTVPSLASVLQMNGQAFAPGPASSLHDWDQVYSDTAGHLAGYAGNSAGTGSLQFTHNPYAGTQSDLSYTSQSKDSADISTWGWNISKPNTKSAIGDGFAAAYPDGGYGDYGGTHTLLYVGADRIDASSASETLGVWFLHTPIALSDPNGTSGTFVVKGSNFVTGATIPSGGGGTGYKVGDILTVVGGQFTTAAQLKVTAVSGGAVTGLSVYTAGAYSVVPLNGTFTTADITTPAATGCRPNLTWSGTVAHHTAGDVLFAANFSSTTSYVAYTWNGSTIPATGTALSPAQGIAQSNSGTGTTAYGTPVPGVLSRLPWAYTNSSGGSSVPVNDFLEEGVDLNELFGMSNAGLPDFSSFVIETRTSNSSTATLQSFILGNISSGSNVAVSKAVDKSPVLAENQVGYTVTVYNAGVIPLTGVTMTDPLPPGPGPAGGPYGAGNITWSIDTSKPNANLFQITGAPGNQTLSFGPAFNGNLSFDASLAVHVIGTATFPDVGTLNNKVTVSAANDDNATDNTAIAQIVVQDNAPVAVNDTYNTPLNTKLAIPAVIGVLANDSDKDVGYGDAIVVATVNGTAVTAAGTTVATSQGGSVTVYPDGHFTYTPKTNNTATDTFTCQAKDSLGTLSNTATVSIAIADHAPVANNDSYSTGENTTLSVAAAGVLANDTDPDGDPTLVATVNGSAANVGVAVATAHGSVTLRANGSFTYTPNGYFRGSDSFTYQASDGALSSNTATVTVTVVDNSTVTAVDDGYNTNFNTALGVPASGVLANDSDSLGNPISVATVNGSAAKVGAAAATAHGSVTLQANGSLTYTPNAGFLGTDSFTYTAKDDGGITSNTATVSITVVDNSAVTAVNDSYSTNENTKLTVPAAGVLANDTDSMGNPISVASYTAPGHGTLTLTADGSFTYTPDANYHGTDSFTYVAQDSGGVTSNTATVTITVADTTPPTANNDNAGTNENTPVTVNVLANDTDADGDSLSVNSVTQGGHGSVVINADNTVTYTPNANFHGTDTFTYTATDGTYTSNAATVTITVVDNSTVTAVNDTYHINASTGVAVSAASGLLANDSDADGDPLTASLVTGPAHGTLTLNADGSFTYTPDGTFQGSDSFTYLASDAAGNHASATVTLVAPVVHAGGNIMLDAGDLWTRTSGYFSDAGVSSGFTVTADYGDGTGLQALESDGSSTSFTLSHTWTTPGTYTVTVTVMDDQGGVSTATFAVVVNPIS